MIPLRSRSAIWLFGLVPLPRGCPLLRGVLLRLDLCLLPVALRSFRNLETYDVGKLQRTTGHRQTSQQNLIMPPYFVEPTHVVSCDNNPLPVRS